MNQFEFIKFERTPSEEKYLGIAYVKAWGKINLRFKMQKNKEGPGYYVSPDAHKKPNQEGKWEDSFLLESNGDKEELEDMIRQRVNQILAQPQILPNQQLPNSPDGTQWNPNIYARQPVQNGPGVQYQHQPAQQNTQQQFLNPDGSLPF